MIRFWKKAKLTVTLKKEAFVKEFPEKIYQCQEQITQWLAFSEANNIKLKVTKGLMLNCDANTGAGEQKKRTEELKRFVKLYIESLVDNMDTFPQDCLEYFAYITHSFYTTPPNFLLKFEINRMLFTTSGGTMYAHSLLSLAWTSAKAR